MYFIIISFVNNPPFRVSNYCKGPTDQKKKPNHYLLLLAQFHNNSTSNSQTMKRLNSQIEVKDRVLCIIENDNTRKRKPASC